MHWGVAWTRAALALIAAGAVGLVLVSGGSVADPRTPPALPGQPPPFLGTAVVGTVGRLDPYKNQVLLVRSMAKLLSPRVRLVIVGEGTWT